MTQTHKRPFDLPTLLLAVVPILLLTLLTVSWVRGGMARKTLMDAARTGNTAELNRLLDHGANINEIDGSGLTPLAYAANERHYEAVRLLLDRGADVNAHGHAETTLYWASTDPWSNHAQPTGSNVKIIKLLLAHGAHTGMKRFGGDTPLLHLTLVNDSAGAMALINGGADVNYAQSAYTALYYAVQNNNTALAELLLAKGADPNLQAKSTGSIPLIEATTLGNVKVMKMLLAHGARTDSRDSLGMTALQWAKRRNDPKAVALLKGAGATR